MLISNYLQTLPSHSPYRTSVVGAVAPGFPTQKACATALHVSPSLVSRAVNKTEDPLLSVKYPPNTHHYNNHTTAQLADTFDKLEQLVPTNSAHEKKTPYGIDDLYIQYQDLPHDAQWTPLNKEYFRQLVHGLHVRLHSIPQYCPLHQLWKASDSGKTLTPTENANCQKHIQFYERQLKAYMNFKDELRNGTFGTAMFSKPSTGFLFVIDFVLLSPSTTRHADCVIHVYGPPTRDSTALTAHSFQFIGRDTSQQPHNAAFTFYAIREISKLPEFEQAQLHVYFSDGGPKEFNSELMSALPLYEREWGIRTKDNTKRVVWNYFAANHGAGAADSDGNHVRKLLQTTQVTERPINSATQMAEIASSVRNTTGVDASEFSTTLTTEKFPDPTGISNYHCFLVEDGNVFGYEDSLVHSGGRNFSQSKKTKRQESLQEQEAHGVQMYTCPYCGIKYKSQHTKCSKKDNLCLKLGVEVSTSKKQKIKHEK